jgi:hypothetical protein
MAAGATLPFAVGRVGVPTTTGGEGIAAQAGTNRPTVKAIGRAGVHGRLATGSRVASPIVPTASAATARAGGPVPGAIRRRAGWAVRQRTGAADLDAGALWSATSQPPAPRRRSGVGPPPAGSRPNRVGGHAGTNRTATGTAINLAAGGPSTGSAARGAGWADDRGPASVGSAGYRGPGRVGRADLRADLRADRRVVRRSVAAATPAHRFRATRPEATASAGSGFLVPTTIRSILPMGTQASGPASLGAARTISPAANPARAGAAGRPSGAVARRDRGAAQPFALRRSPLRGAGHPDNTTDVTIGRARTAAPAAPLTGPADRVRPNDTAGSGRHPTGTGPPAARPNTAPAARSNTATIAGLLLRQVIPAAVVVDAAIAGVIRRMPPAPPTGTPRLGSHRQTGDRRGPDVPRSADPNWSFSGARGERALTGAAIGARTRGSGSLTSPGPAVTDPTGGAVNPTTSTTEVTARRGSLVDLIPPSLFDRARAGLADPTGGGVPGIQPVAMPREVAVSSPTDDVMPRQQIAEALTPREWDELVDIIVDRLEERVLDELARRGRRFTPGVF